MALYRTITVILLSVVLLEAYPYYRTHIPNGRLVPNPCAPGTIWPGVGHENIDGEGKRNPFGRDFEANDNVYNSTLCKKDSDGDGRTNGEELGDPDCTWPNGSPPRHNISLSHPGICEPMTSAQCQQRNAWLVCPKNFSCPAFNSSGTHPYEIRFPVSPVPAEETTYICQAFQLPSNKTLQLIGTTPIINNTNIMHHMILFGCNNTINASMYEEPFKCNMAVTGCQPILALWSKGYDGECHSKEYGFPVGTGGYNSVLLQLHWNNPEKTAGMVDSSGMTLYLTENLRPNNAMVLMTGQFSLSIPPHQPSVSFNGSCTQRCSSLIKPSPIYIAQSTIHMHLQGKSGTIILDRTSNGESPVVLVNETDYDYNIPRSHALSKPLPFYAGDQINVNCVFQTLNKNETTHFGESTSEEMCVGFITVYPAIPGFDQCGQYDDLPICSLDNLMTFGDCDIETFFQLIPVIGQVCNMNCCKACEIVLEGLRDTKCTIGTVGTFVKTYLPPVFPKLGAILNISDICLGKLPMTNTSLIPSSSTMSTSPTMSSTTGNSIIHVPCPGALNNSGFKLVNHGSLSVSVVVSIFISIASLIR